MGKETWVVSGCPRVAAALAAFAGFGTPVLADDCLGPVRDTAASDEPLRPCRQDVNGRPETFACQEFSDAGNRYLLLFKDSPFPRVMVLHREQPGIARVPPPDRAAIVPPPSPVPVFQKTGLASSP
jgi:hypothetical protein